MTILSMNALLIAACLLACSISASASCVQQRVKLQILGSGGPEIADKRASSSYLIWINGKARILIDAGAGSSFNFERAGARIEDLDAILFTHLHVDHSADLPAFIKASFFTTRKRDLLVYGPAGNRLMPSTTVFVQRLLGNKGAFSYLSDYVDTTIVNDYHIKAVDIPLTNKKIKSIPLSPNINLKTIATHHGPVASIAWRINLFDCSISFSGDMSNRYKVLARLANKSDILVAHNAIPQQAAGVARRLHMPPSEIGKIAQQAGIGKLILSHRMLRTLGIETETKMEIRKFYSGPVSFANDLDLFLIRHKK